MRYIATYLIRNLQRCVVVNQLLLRYAHASFGVYSLLLSRQCVCLNARSIINKRNELNIMVEDIDPHIIGITESWATPDISDAELGMTGYVMFRKYRLGRRGGGVILYIKESIQAYEIKLEKEAECEEAVWCNIVTGNSTLTVGLIKHGRE